ncbi:MAG: zinc-binding dehydrogenase [Ktedonobacteraceae bacterium]
MNKKGANAISTIQSIQAIVIDPQVPQRLALRPVEAPVAGPSEVLVRVGAISLNRGEVVFGGKEGARIGWDFAGTVEQAALDGSSPAVGTRVVGLSSGSWAELIAVQPRALAVLPEGVSFAQAASLPIAGLTALYALESSVSLLGRSVLVTGASGGVGVFAVQLAHLAGACVVAQVRQETFEAQIHEFGAEKVVVGEDIASAAAFGPYDIIVDVVGGQTLATAMTLLAPFGTRISVGMAAGMMASRVPLDLALTFRSGSINLRLFSIFSEVAHKPAFEGLQHLLQLVTTGQLKPHIGIEGDWSEIGSLAQALLERKFLGKAVLYVH